jgi:hypothetical protein
VGTVADAPEPESLTVVGEFEALLVMVTVPESAPVVVGANSTLNPVVWPAAREMGSVKPVTVKFADGVICEMETAELPVLVRVTLCEALVVPMVVVGKLSEVGEAERVSTGAVPVPESGTLNEEVGALLASVRMAEKVLAEVGVKPTLNGEEAPGAMVRGRASPEYLKPEPTRAACETVRLALPGLEMVTVWELVTPTVTLETLDGTTEMAGCTPKAERDGGGRIRGVAGHGESGSETAHVGWSTGDRKSKTLSSGKRHGAGEPADPKVRVAQRDLRDLDTGSAGVRELNCARS